MSVVPLCVYCRQRLAEVQWQPFCSERCRWADLGRWLQGDYRVAGPSTDCASDSSEGDDDGIAR